MFDMVRRPIGDPDALGLIIDHYTTLMLDAARVAFTAGAVASRALATDPGASGPWLWAFADATVYGVGVCGGGGVGGSGRSRDGDGGWMCGDRK